MTSESKASSAGPADMFRHENESVDLLLQELNLEGIKSPFGSFEQPPLSGSPVKPLNYNHADKSEKTHTHPESERDDEGLGSKKDFNSSSDTCVSEQNEEEQGVSSNNQGRQRDLAKLVDSAATSEMPNTSPVKPVQKSMPISPSKSSMKSVGTPSPKKSVAFQPSRDTLHLYPSKEGDAAAPSASLGPSPSAGHVTHAWSEVSDHANPSYDVTMTPPAPPPHTSHTITGLLTSSTSDFFGRNGDVNGEDLAASKLEDLKKHRRFSNLSLNEKLSVFLEPSNKSNHDDLDAHLDQLGRATNEETDTNIHRLSYHMGTHETEAENPFRALSQSSDLYLNSAHSSQSSLQSLVDANRQLPADKVNSSSTGIQLYDGIKGFPDSMANTIIPMSNAAADAEDSFSDSSVGFRFSFSQDPEPRHDHQYDQSFNSTEKSIMNLLGPEAGDGGSAAAGNGEHLSSPPTDGGYMQDMQIKVKPEPAATTSESTVEPTVEPIVKLEPASDAEHLSQFSPGENHVQVKQEDHVGVKREASQSQVAKREDSQNSFRFKTEDMQESLVSDYFPEHAAVKQEADEMVAPSRSVKQEETDHVAQESKTPQKHNSADSPAGVATPPQQEQKRGSDNVEDQDEASDAESHNSNELSFATHDPSTDFLTFQVDERAVTPGPVKLVLSRESSSPEVLLSRNPAPSTVNGRQDDNSLSDNSTDVSRVKLATEHHQAPYADSSDSMDSDAYKDSVDYSLKSLAPPRSPAKKDAADQKTAENPGQKAEEDPAKANTSHDGDSSILANSSNINPPLNIKLPVVQKDEAGFADLTQKLAPSSSFEESLSAEHDVDRKPLNFLSIWHTQSTEKKPAKKEFYKAPSLSKYNIADVTRRGQYALPASLQPKKFTDVNVVSARVLNRSFEDLNVSQFLPEISQDSGFEGHFRSLMRNATPAGDVSGMSANGNGNGSGMQYRRRQSFDSSNMLSALQRTASRDVSYSSNLSNGRRRGSVSDTLRPATRVTSKGGPGLGAEPKRSRFHVPSFEIKRSDSVLSPKNQYNDIFSDGSFVEPTIKAAGMKTLPSMDRDDVKRIMQMKQAMSAEEYSRLKHVGASMASAMQAQEQTQEQTQALPQHASICSPSMASPAASARMQHGQNGRAAAGEAAPQKLAEPFAAKPAETPAEKFERFERSVRPSSDSPSTPQNPVLSVPTVQDRPMMPVRRMSDHNPFRASQPDPEDSISVLEPENYDTSVADTTHKFVVKSWTAPTAPDLPVTTPKQQVKSARSSLIKINSPVKVIRKNGTITGVVLDKKIPEPAEPSALHNRKIRGDKNLSTVSVPSNILSEISSNADHASNKSAVPADPKSANSADPKSAVPADLKSAVPADPTSVEKAPQMVKIEEKGKLFFRVVGLKNLGVPELADRNVAFNLTLDNGIHCIKTPNYQLQTSSVAIDKEFELSVSESLEFILTLKATYSKAKPGYKEVTERKVVRSKNKISRLFGSKDIVTTTKFVPHQHADPLESVFATDGSFGRCFVDIDSYRSEISGQACNYQLVCYNEWATYTHNGEKISQKPYPVAQLEVKMLYVPRTEGFEILPTSIKAAYESLDDLKRERKVALEGYLHQEGGDCETWKRRWFKLSGTSLVAHSEFSHKTRAKINLAKVVEVIFVDKENMQQSAANYRNFSDLHLMENAFKIRFADGEMIDFGAPSKTEKQLWIRCMQDIVCRNKFRRQPWVKTMQARNGDKRTSWVRD